MELFKSRTRVAYTNAVGDKVYPVIVDIKRGIKSTEEIQFMSSDINTGILSVAFIQGNENYNISGAEVVCSVMRPDASTLDIPCTSVEDNIVEVPLGINGTSQDGVYSFDFKVFKGGNKVVGTPIMNYSVSLSISNDMVVEEDDRLPVLTVLMTQITALKNETNEVISTANTAIQNANKATDDTKLAISNAQSATQEAEDVIARVNNAIASGTQDLEVKEARDGEATLKARLDRDIEKAKQVYVDVEGSHISTDSSSGYLKDVEIKGNTIQDIENLADIRSVGDTVEGQELYEIPVVSCGKNLFNEVWEIGHAVNGVESSNKTVARSVNHIKVKPNTTYILSKVEENPSRYNIERINFYKNGTFITHVWGSPFATPSDCNEIRILVCNKSEDTYNDVIISDIPKFQLEEGTVATPYEPYVEDKLTILSPTPLEKVGDVRDRIICKDGVWGVEKNIGEVVLNGEENWSYRQLNGSFYFYQVKLPFNTKNRYDDELITNKYVANVSWDKQSEYCFVNEYNGLIISSSISTLDEFKDSLKAVPLQICYQTTQPQFIPLPHDQQVKLRTFANKTNISFLTEIEGTIKAQVPKSLGATVNTHTTQISNLNKELDRVKKLEESTVSTVETESDFTTVEATSNGYFEDVKLEGKTLVNYISNFNNWSNMGSTTVSDDGSSITINATAWNKGRQISKILPSGYYIFSINNPNNATIVIQNKNNTKTLFNGNNADINFEFSLSEASDILVTCKNTSESGTYIVSNPILTVSKDFNTYFEGLKSVGQGADEIVVSSVKGDGNLWDGTYEIGSISTSDGTDITNGTNRKRSFYIPVNKGVYYASVLDYTNTTHQLFIHCYDKNKKPITWNYGGYIIGVNSTITTLTIPTNGKYIKFRSEDDRVLSENSIIITSTNIINSEIEHKSDKKRLLFYNNETQTWEKPILRQWDSIEKHSDGKYYYHQRSGEVVLNGSENWGITSTDTNTIRFYTNLNNASTTNNVIIPAIMDKFTETTAISQDVEGFNLFGITNNTRIRISKTKLSTQDVAGFKQWLQANNVTVVYQLAEEKVYECTNIDLITYANETNYIVESGAIAPKSILKVHNNISNVVKILQEKVSLLENKFIEGLKQVLAGDMYSLAELLYPEDFKEVETENSIMLIPLE